ncbi:MAG: hypothetical protein CMF24_08185 [Ilumatobacter sp.]|nr:hypothetical protein [Ilumatobacter sp.]
MSIRSVGFGDPNEFDDDFANRPLSPRDSRPSRVVWLAAIAAVVAIVAAGLVISGGDGTDNSPPVTRSTP